MKHRSEDRTKANGLATIRIASLNEVDGRIVAFYGFQRRRLGRFRIEPSSPDDETALIDTILHNQETITSRRLRGAAIQRNDSANLISWWLCKSVFRMEAAGIEPASQDTFVGLLLV